MGLRPGVPLHGYLFTWKQEEGEVSILTQVPSEGTAVNPGAGPRTQDEGPAERGFLAWRLTRGLQTDHREAVCSPSLLSHCSLPGPLGRAGMD